jgi:hypothetical protein
MMMPPRTSVTATDLVLWASRREAQELLPVLLRRLMFATGVGLKQVGLPAHESVQQGGWDGVVAASGDDVFVPAGPSVWEFGVTDKVRPKADSDYDKRTKNPLGVDPAQTTFVFVTPRKWAKKHEWVKDRLAEGHWRDVRAYDADDLEQWLERAPAVLAWFAELLGLRIDDAWELGSHWRDWAASTSPALAPGVVLAGRGAPLEALKAWWKSNDTVATVAAASREEALAVIGAFVEELDPDERDRIHSGTLVVSSESAWQRLARFDRSLVLIPSVDGLEVGAALRRGHRVLVPAEAATVGSASGVVEVGRLSAGDARHALVAMGMTEPRAEELAALARRNLLAFRRAIAVTPGAMRPAWSRDPAAAKLLLPLLLLGRWNHAHPGDRVAVASLAGTSYEEVEAALLRMEVMGDPPARRVGSTWRAVSIEELWDALAPLLTEDVLRRYLELAVPILVQVAPTGGLGFEARMLASIEGDRTTYSDLLRQGVAEALAFLGTFGAGAPASSPQSAADIAQRVVRQVMEQATGQLPVAASVAPLLPDLVEAAPDAVLRAIDADLRGSAPTLVGLFQDSRDDWFSSSPHTGLLWALERLGWSPTYLAGAVLQLARLARLDPGGRLTNRPAASLTDFFRGWHPTTNATLEVRLDALDMVRRAEPSVAWQLLTSLLPTGHDTAMVKAPPRWRDWASDWRRPDTWNEIDKATDAVVSRVLVDVGPIGARWEPLLDALGHLSASLADRVLSHLEALPIEGVGDADREAVRSRLRSLLSRHRSVDDPGHRLPDGVLERLDRLLARLLPESAAHRHAWVFTWWPDLPEGREGDFEARQAAVARAKEDAARELVHAGSLPTVLECAQLVAQPEMLGDVVGRVMPLEDEVGWLGGCLTHEEVAIRRFAHGYIAGRFARDGWEWAEELLDRAQEPWLDEALATALLSLPNSGRTWSLAEELGPDIEQSYWARMGPFGLNDPLECERAAKRFLEAGRPFVAVEQLGLYARREGKPLDSELIAAALEAAVRYDGTERPMMGSFDHTVEELLDALSKSGAVDDGRLAWLEWQWMPMFRFGRREPEVLHRELARNPEFFVELVTMIYRAEGEEPGEGTEQDRRRAEVAHDLLQNWRTFPGFSADGESDAERLREWVTEARRLLAERGRKAVGDICIGHLLSSPVHGTDGGWPHEAVRDIVEACGSDDLEQGIHTGVYNSRGVVTKDPLQGGDSERGIAGRYEDYASMVSSRWPRTAALLRSIGGTYRHDAKREDLDAEAREDG